LATAGGLVFQGTSDGYFKTYDAARGTELWSFKAGSGIIAPPISYSIDGEQYIAVLAGYGGAAADAVPLVVNQGRLPGRLIVFKLGAKLQLPMLSRPVPAPLDITGITSTGDAERGLNDYTRYCFVCHGASAANSFNADLRRAGALRSAKLWRDVVIGGALSANGMVSFSDVLDENRAENVRAYVLSEAQQAQAANAGGSAQTTYSTPQKQ
jgi:quinohemoprotein ethanol dehydrogenase